MTTPEPEDFSHLIGLTPAEAAALEHNVRVTVRDGKPMICTRDYRPERINVSTVDGKITGVGRRG